MTEPLPPYAPRELVQQRLVQIFPEGFEPRNYCIRDTAAATVFSMLYIGALEGTGRLLAPKQVYRMSDEQAALTSDAERFDFASQSLQGGFKPRGQAWYADNSREAIRDETLRQGYVPVGAAIEDKTVATTANKPRYALARDFAALFDPALTGDALAQAIEQWQNQHLSKAALARVKLVKAGAGAGAKGEGVLVTFPNEETRRLKPGKSAIISKAVIEEFAPRFLDNPAVVWLSESGHKVVKRDDDLARSINLNIDVARNLPDIVLVDLGEDARPENMLLVFVEVVATDGPINDLRREELLKLSRAAHFEDRRVAFVTAYLDRSAPALRKTFPSLAWNTFVWLASEPENIVALYGETTSRLHALLKGTIGKVTPLRPA